MRGAINDVTDTDGKPSNLETKYPLSLQGQNLEFKLMITDYQQYALSKWTIWMNHSYSTQPLLAILMDEYLWQHNRIVMLHKSDDERNHLLQIDKY